MISPVSTSSTSTLDSGASQPSIEAVKKLARAYTTTDLLRLATTSRGPGDDRRLHFEATRRLDPDEKEGSRPSSTRSSSSTTPSAALPDHMANSGETPLLSRPRPISTASSPRPRIRPAATRRSREFSIRGGRYDRWGGRDDRATPTIVRPTDLGSSHRVIRLSELTSRRPSLRAAAVVANTRVPQLDSDAIEVALEHVDGQALRVLLPYVKRRFRRGVEYGLMNAASGSRRVWPPA